MPGAFAGTTAATSAPVVTPGESAAQRAQDATDSKGGLGIQSSSFPCSVSGSDDLKDLDDAIIVAGTQIVVHVAQDVAAQVGSESLLDLGDLGDHLESNGRAAVHDYCGPTAPDMVATRVLGSGSFGLVLEAFYRDGEEGGRFAFK